MVAARKRLQSRDHRERYNANFCNFVLEFRHIEALSAEEPGIDGPGARSDHHQNGPEDRLCEGNPWIAGM
jgi:hypothetical protein